MQLSWFPGRNMYVQAGNYYGYSRVIHAVRDILTRRGVQYTAQAPLAFHLVAPHVFVPTHNKFNILYTMYESPDLAKDAAERIRKADLIITPSDFCTKSFQRLVKCPVVTIPLGVDEVPYQDHRLDHSRPFRFMYCGAWNVRKGWFALASAWEGCFAKYDFLELYIKTTSHTDKLHKVYRRGNALIDARNLSWEEMCNLYHQADCLVMPTLGEGWGNTLAEAMMAGVPVITTEYSGLLEFANRRNCTFAKHTIERIKANMGGDSEAPDGLFRFAIVDRVDLATKMAHMLDHYDNALVMAKRAAKDIRAFTWDRMADALLDLFRMTLKKAA